MTDKPYENLKCPDCSGPMISRTGKFGVFWGCKSYPNCKGTRDSQGMSKAEKQKTDKDYDEDKRTYSDDKEDKETFDSLMRDHSKCSFRKS